MNTIDTNAVIDTFYRTIDTTLNAATSLSKIIADLLEPFCQDNQRREQACNIIEQNKKEPVRDLDDYILLESLKKGRTYYQTFASKKEASSFENNLKDYGIPHIGIYYDKKYLILADKKDKDLFEKLYRKEQITKKLESKDCNLTLSDLKLYTNQNVLKITDLDKATLKLFSQACNERHLVHSFVGPNNDRYVLYYAGKDRHAFDVLKEKVALSKSAPTFDLLKAKQEANEKVSQNQLRTLLNNKQQEPFVVCDKEDKIRIRIEKQFMILEDEKNHFTKIKRDELTRQDKDKIIEHYLKMNFPVTFKKSEYEEIKTRRSFVDPSVYFVSKQQAVGYKPIVKEEITDIAKSEALIGSILKEPVLFDSFQESYPITNEDFSQLHSEIFRFERDIEENPETYLKETLTLKEKAREVKEEYAYHTKNSDVSDSISEVLDGVSYEMREEKATEIDNEFEHNAYDTDIETDNDFSR